MCAASATSRPWLSPSFDCPTAGGRTRTLVPSSPVNVGELLDRAVERLTASSAIDHWQRDREPFLNRGRAGAWDHAMSWIDCQLPVGDEVFLYYGGYARGHKVERFTERQIGLARMLRDRYAAREAGAVPGSLRTPLVTLDAKAMTLNADAVGGEIRVQIADPAGKPVPGYSFADCAPISADSVAVPVKWKRPLSGLKGRPIRLEFRLQRARLFAFDLR